MVLYVCYMAFNLSYIDNVNWLASYAQVYSLEDMISSLQCRSSIFLYMTLPSCNLVNHYTSVKFLPIDLIFSNNLCFSLISASILCKFKSSCNEVHFSMAYSNNWVKPLTATYKVSISSLIVALSFSLTSRGVLWYDLSCISKICSFSSNLTLVIYDCGSFTVTTIFWILFTQAGLGGI